ncbi:hypothetical protein Tco_1313837 [Tanacetum coccineum]
MIEVAADDQGEGSEILTDPHHTPVDPVPSTLSPPPILPITEPPHSSPPRSIHRQDFEIPQSLGPTLTFVADKATTTSVEVGTEGATTTTPSLDARLDSDNIHESPLRSYDSPLPEGNTSGSAEDSLKLKELSELLPKLVMKIDSLEKELKETKQTFGHVVIKLVERVKSLEGRKIQDIDDDPLVSLARASMNESVADFITPSKVSALGEAQEKDTSPTTMEAARTLSQERIKTTELNTGSSPVKSGSAEISTEEEELSKQQKKRRDEVQEAAKYYYEEEWNTIRAKLKASAELTKISQGENVFEDDFAKKMVDMINKKKKYYAEQKAKAKRDKPMTQAQQRDYMRTFIKNQSTSLYSEGWIMVQLNKLTFEELKQEFEKLIRSIERIVPMRSEERIKRPGIELEQEPSKKQKTVGSKEVLVIQENVEEPVIVKEEEIAKPGDDEDSEYEKEKEQLSLYLTIASDEDKEVDYEILDQKSLIIEWKSEYYGLKPMPDEVEVPEEINVNVVTRRNGSKRYFSLLLNALSVFDREDLCALYQLVMDKYQDEIPQGFDRILWGDLTTMFHPIELDEVWKSQQNWNIMSWKLHNSSGVHTLQTDTDMIINMLVEKKYPLMKKILLQMLKVKLTTEENSTMAMDLIKFIQQQIEDENV